MTKQMLTPQQNVSDGAYKEQIAIGPFLIQRTNNKDPKGVYFEFTGVNAGFLAFGIASIEGGNGVVIMMNSGDDVNGLGKEIRRAVAKTYNWTNFLPKEIEPTSLPINELDKFTGRYKMSDDEVLSLKRENNYLVEKINDGNDIYCFPISKDTQDNEYALSDRQPRHPAGLFLARGGQPQRPVRGREKRGQNHRHARRGRHCAPRTVSQRRPRGRPRQASTARGCANFARASR